MKPSIIAKWALITVTALSASASFSQKKYNASTNVDTQYRVDLGPTPVGDLKAAFKKKGEPIPDNVPDLVERLKNDPVEDKLSVVIGGESIPNGCRFFLDVENLSNTATLGGTAYAEAVYVGPESDGKLRVMTLKQMQYGVYLAPRTATRKAYDVAFTADQRVADPSLASFKSCDDAYFINTWAKDVKYNKENLTEEVGKKFVKRTLYTAPTAVKFAWARSEVPIQTGSGNVGNGVNTPSANMPAAEGLKSASPSQGKVDLKEGIQNKLNSLFK